MKNIIVGQSGGPTAVINASLCGVIRQGLKEKDRVKTVYGMANGIEGFLEDRCMDLGTLSEEQLHLLSITPGAYLGSCRHKLPEDLRSPVYPALLQRFDRMDIGYVFYIGGNDSMDTVSKLSRYAALAGSGIRFIGIPKTIDNDLVLTDHTPGYGSAAKYVAATVREIALDAGVYQQRSVTIVEIMGRHAGWLTAASVMARQHTGDNPLLIYLPEAPFDFQRFSADLDRAFKQTNNVVVCVSEGIADASRTFICEYASEAHTDTFGHKMLTGCGKVLENYVRREFGVKVRSVELNVSQRCSGMIASATDVAEAEAAGSFGVSAALSGETGKMVGFSRSDSNEYENRCCLVDVNQVCNKEKTFPARWITNGGCDVSEDFLSYARPLILGEVQRPMENGLPVYLQP